MISVQEANSALSKGYLLIKFTGGTYYNNKALSRKLSDEAVKSHHLKSGDVHSYIQAFPKACRGPLDDCNSAWGELRAMTKRPPIIPFGDTTERFSGLISAGYYVGEFGEAYHHQLAVANAALDNLCNKRDQMVAFAETERRNTDLVIEYPEAADFRGRYWAMPLHKMVTTVPAITSTEDLALPANAAGVLVDDLVKQGVEASPVVQDMRATMANIQNQLRNSMRELNDRIVDFEAGHSVRFTGALTDNIKHTLTAMRQCNLFESDEVYRLADALDKRMHMLKPETIKASKQGAENAKQLTEAFSELSSTIDWGVDV